MPLDCLLCLVDGNREDKGVGGVSTSVSESSSRMVVQKLGVARELGRGVNNPREGKKDEATG